MADIELIPIRDLKESNNVDGFQALGVKVEGSSVETVRVPIEALKGNKGDRGDAGQNGKDGEVTTEKLNSYLADYAKTTTADGTVVRTSDGNVPDTSKGLEDLKEKLYGNETKIVFFPYTDDFTAGTIIKTGVPQNPPRRYTYANWSNILGKTIKKITVFCSNTNGGTFSMTFDETGSNPISYQLVYGKNEIEVNIPVPLNGLNVLWFNMDNIAYIDNPNGNKTGGKAYVYLYNKEKRIFNADINIGLEVAETVGNAGDIDQIRTDANIGKNKISIPVTSNPTGGASTRFATFVYKDVLYFQGKKITKITTPPNTKALNIKIVPFQWVGVDPFSGTGLTVSMAAPVYEYNLIAPENVITKEIIVPLGCTLWIRIDGAHQLGALNGTNLDGVYYKEADWANTKWEIRNDINLGLGFELENIPSMNRYKSDWHHLGDSISESEGHQWCDYVRDAIGLRLFNHARKGKVINEMIAQGVDIPDGYTGLLTAMIGTNELTQNHVIGSASATTAKATADLNPNISCDAFRLMLEHYITRMPFAKIVYITNIKCWNYGITPTSLRALQVELIKLCEYYSIPYIDAFYLSGISDYNYNLYLNDGAHPDAKGHRIIGQNLAGFIDMHLRF